MTGPTERKERAALVQLVCEGPLSFKDQAPKAFTVLCWHRLATIKLETDGTATVSATGRAREMVETIARDGEPWPLTKRERQKYPQLLEVER